MSVFLIANTSSTCLPLTHSVATDDEAMADPQPKVLNFDSSILPLSSTFICSYIEGRGGEGETMICSE